MARLIDADEFAKTLEKTDANVCADYGDGFCEFGYSRSLLRLLLSEAPTVDAVEVVRCVECTVPHNRLTGCPKLNGLVTPPDFYCPYGERKSDGRLHKP